MLGKALLFPQGRALVGCHWSSGDNSLAESECRLRKASSVSSSPSVVKRSLCSWCQALSRLTAHQCLCQVETTSAFPWS